MSGKIMRLYFDSVLRIFSCFLFSGVVLISFLLNCLLLLYNLSTVVPIYVDLYHFYQVDYLLLVVLFSLFLLLTFY